MNRYPQFHDKKITKLLGRCDMNNTLLIISLCSLGLTACTPLISSMQKNNHVPLDTYPASMAIDHELADNPPMVDLTQYKSVHSRFKKNNDVAIALAASGGGYRAANFTLGVLLGLEKIHCAHEDRNLLTAVDYYSTVSGGGFAVGFYLTQLHNHLLLHPHDSFLLENTLAHNPLSTDLSSYLFFGKNRGIALETKLNELFFTTSSGELTLGDIFIPKQSEQPVALPYWVANASIYQNAAIFPFAPDVLNRYHVVGYEHNKIANPYAFPAAVGTTASASVPLVTPATTLVSNGCNENCYLHLYDGGLTDNLGIYSALNFLLQDTSKTKILIVVDASKANTQPYSHLPSNPRWFSLVRRLPQLNLDAFRQHMRPNIDFLLKHLFPKEKVMVVYLDLNNFPEAQKISTTLAMSLQDQKRLIEIGEKLVKENALIKKISRLV